MTGIVTKSLATLAGLTGVSTAVSVPLALKSKNGSDNSLINQQGGGNESYKNHNKKGVNFEKLGEQIDQQGLNKGTDKPQSLPGKENLNQVIVGNSSNSGVATEIFWTDCQTTPNEQQQENVEEKINSCGYLGLNDGSLEFKVKAMQKQNQEEGEVFVVRDQREQSHFYDHTENHWKSVSKELFSKLTMPDDNSQGSQITGSAFTTSKTRNK